MKIQKIIQNIPSNSPIYYINKDIAQHSYTFGRILAIDNTDNCIFVGSICEINILILTNVDYD